SCAPRSVRVTVYVPAVVIEKLYSCGTPVVGAAIVCTSLKTCVAPVSATDIDANAASIPPASPTPALRGGAAWSTCCRSHRPNAIRGARALAARLHNWSDGAGNIDRVLVGR